ncbi:hypothetical protein OESDEN_12155 [Oesophagostomum dentatum]|uniref:Uncharacterized protein n=1 Tax=Oesophagostomum dentatum TaxID=61180 RepID=A0A0B1SXZ4_OESDE|nr:hypothetical protein OESDEN_12155 [Oesophagostomum dentatum]
MGGVTPFTPYSQNSHYTPPVSTVRNHVSIPMEHEPRRVGLPLRRDSTEVVEARPYQRRIEDTVKYSPDSTSPYTRSLEV